MVLYIQVQIGDFGLAKQELQENIDISGPPTPMVSSGAIVPRVELTRTPSVHTSGVGTQAYGAPEQLNHGLIDEKVSFPLIMRFDYVNGCLNLCCRVTCTVWASY